ncbi:MAG: AMIN domain-containing protein [Sulfurimonas sp.]|nr:AMIN domain-containing protein [Sulfurimonas sp.]PHQ92545.1 MAG: AMIN domain-containing protein [Sulfurimonas sp.]
MVKVFLITSFLIFTLLGRENPFFPSKGEQDLPYTSNEKENIPELSRVSLSLPSTARNIKKITIEYENLDASVDTKSIELKNRIDWHLPIFISQSYSEIKTVTQTEAKKPNQTSKKIKAKIKKQQEKKIFKKVAEIEYAKFLVSKNNLKIISSDTLMRNFLLGQPHRIVMDFKRESSMKTYSKDIENSMYTKIRIGNHKGYYRVVIELDGYYRYRLKKMNYGCLISLQ